MKKEKKSFETVLMPNKYKSKSTYKAQTPTLCFPNSISKVVDFLKNLRCNCTQEKEARCNVLWAW